MIALHSLDAFRNGVKLSPDNQNAGWQAGYQPTERRMFLAIYTKWTMGGLGMMPTNGPLQTIVGDETDPIQAIVPDR